MKIGRYSCIIAVIPAPETPPKINKGGSQHQLEAMNADSNAPKLAKRSLRPAETPSVDGCCVAHGDLTVVDAQQSAAGAGPGIVSSDMVLPVCFLNFHFFFYLCFESMLDNGRDQLFDRDLIRIEFDEQQIEVFIRFKLSFPLVFDRLDTFKL